MLAGADLGPCQRSGHQPEAHRVQLPDMKVSARGKVLHHPFGHHGRTTAGRDDGEFLIAVQYRFSLGVALGPILVDPFRTIDIDVLVGAE